MVINITLIPVGLIAWIVALSLIWKARPPSQRRHSLHFCPTCHYDLSGITGKRCPECGLDLLHNHPIEFRLLNGPIVVRHFAAAIVCSLFATAITILCLDLGVGLFAVTIACAPYVAVFGLLLPASNRRFSSRMISLFIIVCDLCTLFSFGLLKALEHDKSSLAAVGTLLNLLTSVSIAGIGLLLCILLACKKASNGGADTQERPTN